MDVLSQIGFGDLKESWAGGQVDITMWSWGGTTGNSLFMARPIRVVLKGIADDMHENIDF
jgi:hypothetical protein